MPNCNRCGTIIRWIESKQGKNIPLDVKPIDNLTIEPFEFLYTAGGKCFKTPKEGKDGVSLTQTYFRAHFNTCVFKDAPREAPKEEEITKKVEAAGRSTIKRHNQQAQWSERISEKMDPNEIPLYQKRAEDDDIPF